MHPKAIAKALRYEYMPDVNGICAILLWILAAVMYGDGGIVAYLAVMPLILGFFAYGVAQYYHRKNGGWKQDGS